MGDTLLVIEVHLVSRAEDAEMMMHNIPKIRRNLMLLLLLLDGFKLKKCSEGVIFNIVIFYFTKFQYFDINVKYIVDL